MKKKFIFIGIMISIILLTGCSKNKQENKSKKTEVTTITTTTEAPTLKEGKYTQIAPSNVGSQGEGYDTYLTLEKGKVTLFDTYFEATTEGTYTLNDNELVIHYTRNYGQTTYGEAYDEQIDRTFYCHIDGKKIIVDSVSDYTSYTKGSIIFELK